MTEPFPVDRQALPSTATLLKATCVAVAVAAVVLLTTILPAEYGMDPTGVGTRLGLTSMSSPGAAASSKAEDAAPQPATTAVAPPAVAPTGAVWKSAAPYRTDELSVKLLPNEGAEIKAIMKTGERLVFSWVAEGGPVNFDMHGEQVNAKQDDFTSYWKGRAENSGHGAFEAPFDGTHGWYWRNRGRQPVTVRVKTSGFYEKLYRP